MIAVALVVASGVARARDSSSFEVNDDSTPAPALVVPPHPSVAAMESLGRQLFFDRSLSASHTLSCSSCHDPAYAYGPPNAKAVQLGGKNGRLQGQRAVPSLRYLQNVPLFTENYFDEDFDESVDNGPTGGFTWDGRARNPHEQARLPLLSPLEMANARIEDVVAAVKAAPYAADFRQAFGERVFDVASTAFDAIVRSIEVFEQNAAEFYPYSSKYDAALRHQASFSERERRGLELFNDPAKGNCARCHQSERGSSGAFPAFTDFGYIAIGVPRNRALAVNADPKFYDLGLCGPLREEYRERAEYCGLFRTPSLRNVTLRKTFFHNGAFHDLRQVLRFYVERDIHPEKWYPNGEAFDDLPARFRENLNREPPFDRHPGDEPALSESEITDVIAFLGTLTDGWSGK